jgi:hypothetical protein
VVHRAYLHIIRVGGRREGAGDLVIVKAPVWSDDDERPRLAPSQFAGTSIFSRGAPDSPLTRRSSNSPVGSSLPLMAALLTTRLMRAMALAAEGSRALLLRYVSSKKQGRPFRYTLDRCAAAASSSAVPARSSSSVGAPIAPSPSALAQVVGRALPKPCAGSPLAVGLAAESPLTSTIWKSHRSSQPRMEVALHDT